MFAPRTWPKDIEIHVRMIVSALLYYQCLCCVDSRQSTVNINCVLFLCRSSSPYRNRQHIRYFLSTLSICLCLVPFDVIIIIKFVKVKQVDSFIKYLKSDARKQTSNESEVKFQLNGDANTIFDNELL